MKQTKPLTILLFAILLINACSKDSCDDSTKNLYVDKTYLPYIIPYSDTSTRLFLKNGKDTLLFKSKGLEETTNFYQESAINGLCRKYNMQKLSLTMAASDTDFFEVNYYADYSDEYGTGFVKINISDFFETKPLSDFSYNRFIDVNFKDKLVFLGRKQLSEIIHQNKNFWTIANQQIKQFFDD